MKINDLDSRIYISIIEQADRLLLSTEILETSKKLIWETKDAAEICLSLHTLSR